MSGPVALDITGIDHAELLAALYNGTRAVGLGFLHDVGKMTVVVAREILEERGRLAFPPGRLRFDYVLGRPIKVGLQGNLLQRPDLYDCDAPGGPGSCARIVEALRQECALQKATRTPTPAE